MVNDEEKIEVVKTRFITGNLIALIWILIASIACSLINPWLGWFFLAFSAFSVYIIIRRFMCNSCYYCKSCTKGLAKLSILFLGANKIPGLSKSTIIGMVIFAYVVLSFIPGALLVNSLLTSFETIKLVSLICLLAISAVIPIGRIIYRNKNLWKP